MLLFGRIPINLPIPVVFHAVGLVLYGGHMVIHSPKRKELDNGRGGTASAVVDDGLKGLLLLGIGAAYLTTAYLPREQNAWLYAVVPVRILLGSVSGLRLYFLPGLSSETRADMWTLLLADGVLGVVTGWQLGRFDGRLPGW